MTNQNRRAAACHALPVPGTALVLPRAGDAVSARLVGEAGAAAPVATTGAGLVRALGAADGERGTKLPRPPSSGASPAP
jgi:2-methylisocitrate lyase-like PEP mutase family enzyme